MLKKKLLSAKSFFYHVIILKTTFITAHVQFYFLVSFLLFIFAMSNY